MAIRSGKMVIYQNFPGGKTTIQPFFWRGYYNIAIFPGENG